MRCFYWPSIALFVTIITPLAATAQSEAQLELVREHDERGRLLFEDGDYEAALGEMQTAQELLPAAPRLYNMAVCEERLGRLERALALYLRFVESEDVPEERRMRAEQQIGALRAELAATQNIEPIPATPEEDHALSPVPFYSMLGATLVSGLTLAILGGTTASRHSEYQALEVGDPTARELWDEGRSLAIATNIFIGITAACALTAAVLAFFTRWQRASTPNEVVDEER